MKNLRKLLDLISVNSWAGCLQRNCCGPWCHGTAETPHLFNYIPPKHRRILSYKNERRRFR